MIERQMSLIGPEMSRAADIDPTWTFRYDLRRQWGEGPFRVVNFVMLNPSTADANDDDPTIRRCINFAKSWDFNGLVVTNLFAYRATDPRELATPDDSIGPENDRYIRRWARDSELVVCAWGVNSRVKYRAPEVLYDIRKCGKVPMVLKHTKDGSPTHPLYLPSYLTPIPLRGEDAIS